MKIKSPITPSRSHKIKCGVAKGISFLAGDVHFVLKTAADITARAEAHTCSSLTGKPVHHIIEDRHNKTERAQTTVIESYRTVKKFVKNTIDDIESELVNSEV